MVLYPCLALSTQLSCLIIIVSYADGAQFLELATMLVHDNDTCRAGTILFLPYKHAAKLAKK